MSNQKKFSITFNQAFLDEVNSKLWEVEIEKLIEIAESIPGKATEPVRNKFAESVIAETLNSLGAEGEFFFYPDQESMAICSIMSVPKQLEGQNQIFVMYNPEYVACMDKKHIAANITFAFQQHKLMESKTLVCINRRTGEWIYKGKQVNYTLENNMNVPLEQCSPWRQDTLPSLCDELDIPLTNNLSQLTGIEQGKVQKIYDSSIEQHQIVLEYRKAVMTYKEKQHA